MLTAAEYRATIQRLEGELTRRPGWYRTKVALLALLGYAFLGAALVLALALSVGLGALLFLTKSVWALKLIKLVWVPLVVAWSILRAMWVPLSAPDGQFLAPGQAPMLEHEVERLRRAAGAPRLAGIVVTSELNAAAASVPRLLGLLGSRHYLVLGLPLMRVLSPAELSAVVAHEFGHFDAGHGRLSGWIYRLRSAWARLRASFAQGESAAAGVFARFFGWYAPYFDAYSFVLARNNEFDADAVSARIAGPDAAARALVRLQLAAHRLHGEFWPGIDRLARTQGAPPGALYADMTRVITAGHESDDGVLATALAREADLDDTHPALSQRLAALGVVPALPGPLAGSAADALLGAEADRLQGVFDAEWQHAVEAQWRERHGQLAGEAEKLAELDQRAQDGTLDIEAALEHAGLVESQRSAGEALARYRQLLPAHGGDARVQFQVGRLLLADDDATGISHLEQAASLDPEMSLPALICQMGFHSRQGDAAACDAVADRMREAEKRQRAIARQRRVLEADDAFDAHGLVADELEAVNAAITATGGVGRAWLVRKRIRNAGPPAHYVLLVAWRGILWSKPDKLRVLAQAVPVPGTLVVADAGIGRRIAGRIKSAAGVPILHRGWFG